MAPAKIAGHGSRVAGHLSEMFKQAVGSDMAESN
jgi:hypothetical protein